MSVDHYSLFNNFSNYQKPYPVGVKLPEIVVEQEILEDLNLSADSDSKDILYELTRKGLRDRGITKQTDKKVYYDRAKMELDVFDDLGFVDYILLNWDVLNFCKNNGIPTGAGRGSAAGSLVLYLLGVTNIDDIFSKLRYMIIGCQCEWVIIDHLHMLVNCITESDERRGIDQLMNRLRSLVEETGVGMFLVAHLRRAAGDRGHEQGVVVSLSHLKGSQGISQLSDSVIALERNQQAEDPEEANTTRVRVLKSRYTGDTGLACNLKYNLDTGRMHEVTGEETFDDIDF